MAEQQNDKAATEVGIGGVRHLIAVASAKGGVGKSTVAVNLAIALAKMGKRVGLVDADVLGPSVPGMLGLKTGAMPQLDDNGITPPTAHGIATISMAMLTDDDTPAILRGPMVSKYLQLFFGGVRWGKLDFLIIDLPPGTGDTQLTLVQQMPLSGAVIVTTPQEVSLKITRRGMRMFERVQVPILGVIENMSGFACPHCGESTPIFRQGGGERLATDLAARFLGPVPLDVDVVESGDAGQPVVVTKPDSVVAKAYQGVADNLVAACGRHSGPVLPQFNWQWDDANSAPPWIASAVRGEDGAPNIPIGMQRRGSRTFAILWQDGLEQEIDVRDLRLACECAECIEEMTGRALLKPDKVPTDVAPTRISSVGRYAIGIHWTDGHSSGIYSNDLLRRLAERAGAQPEVAV